MANQSAKQNMYKGAIVLSLASVLVKLMSAIYKVPFQNLTGNEGFYVYQQVYPLYGIAIVFSLNGMPLFISKLVSQEADEKQKEQLVQSLFTLMLSLSLVIWGGLQLFAGPIARFMGDGELKPLIQITSHFYLTLPFLAIFRGTFQGENNMMPTAISQVGEQFVRITIILLVAFNFASSSWSIHQLGTYALSSAFLSGLSAVMILTGFMVFSDLKLTNLLKLRLPNKALLKRFWHEGLEIILLASLMVLFQLVDSFTVFNGLIESGMNQSQAMAVKGIYDRAQPFVQLGISIALAISTSLLPSLSHYLKQGNHAKWEKESASALKLTIILSSAITVGLIAVLPWLNEAFFLDNQKAATIQVYLMSILFVSVSLCIQAILQSRSQKMKTTRAILLALVIKAVFNFFAVAFFGTIGSSLMTVIGTLILCGLMVQQLPKAVTRQVFHSRVLTVVVIGNGLMAGGVIGLRRLIPISGRLESLIGVLVLAVVGVLIYGLVLLKGKILTEHELEQLPLQKVWKKVGKLHE